MKSFRTARSVAACCLLTIVGVLTLGRVHLACAPPAFPASARSVVSDPDLARNPPRQLSPLREGTWTYDVIEGRGKGQSVTQVVKRESSDASAPWRRVFSANNVIAHLRQQADGSIVMLANEILDHNVVNTFDPPQVVLAAPEALGSPVRVTSKVVTRLRGGPKLQVDRGTAESVLTPLGTETLDTPAGSFKCQIFELRLHLKFGLGEVQSCATLHYADGVGLVAETYEENATSFFITSNTKRKTVLKAYPK